MSAGQELTLDTGLTKVRMGIGWDKDPGAGAAGFRNEVDLDATAVQFAGGKLFDLAFYNNLATRDGSVLHAGDNQTGAGAGDDESIAVDLSKVHGPVDQIVFLVSSYQGHSLQWIRDAYCVLVDEVTGADLARFRLTLSVPDTTGLVLAKLVRSGAGWELHAIGEPVAITVPTQGLAKLNRFL